MPGVVVVVVVVEDVVVAPVVVAPVVVEGVVGASGAELELVAPAP